MNSKNSEKHCRNAPEGVRSRKNPEYRRLDYQTLNKDPGEYEITSIQECSLKKIHRCLNSVYPTKKGMQRRASYCSITWALKELIHQKASWVLIKNICLR